MLRPRPDLDAIDRELEQLGTPREDIAELVAKYAGPDASAAQFDRTMVMLSEPRPIAGDASPSDEPPSDEAEELDHDDFELLVDDADMDRLEDDDELESVA